MWGEVSMSVLRETVCCIPELACLRTAFGEPAKGME